MKGGKPSDRVMPELTASFHELQIFDCSGKGYDWRAAARFLFTINSLAYTGRFLT